MNSNNVKIYIISVLLCIIASNPITEIGYRIDFSVIPNNNLFIHHLISSICLGVDPQCLNITLSFQTYFSWICSGKHSVYNKTNSITYKELNATTVISAMNKVYSAHKVQDVLTTQYNKEAIVKFGTIDEVDCDVNQGEIGLNVKDLILSTRSNESIIEQLRNKSIIDDEILSIRYINKTNGYVIFGDLYSEYDEMKYIEISTSSYSIVTSGRFVESVSFYMKKQTNRWNKYNSLLTYEVNRRLLLDFSSNFITVPEKIFIRLKDDVFRSFITTKMCSLTNTTNNDTIYIICDKKVFPMMRIDTIAINLGRTSKIEFNVKQTFVKEKDKFICGIVTKKNHSYISLGDVYLRKYIVLFDMKRKTFRLYPKDSVNAHYGYLIFGMILLFIFAMGLLIYLGNIIEEVFFKRRKKYKQASGRKSSIQLIKKNKFDE